MDLGHPEYVEHTFDDGYTPPRRGKNSYKQIKYYINENGCWICTSHAKAKHRRNYPVIERHGKHQRLSRYMFKVVNGYIDENKVVMHSCDNPECINPDHLSLGTHKENTHDMIAKNRKPVGEAVIGAKLTEDQVIDIFNDSRGCNTLAKEYGVSKKTILNIRHGKTWKHLGLLKESNK